MPRILPVDEASLNVAAAMLRDGGVVAFPTETVYGLGANALNPVAVARIFEIKARPTFDPLIVHVPGIDQAFELAASFPPLALKLAERFWPGPLTLVLPKQSKVPDLVTSGLPNVGIRIPNHPATLRLLELAGIPLAGPSANRFGSISPTNAAHVQMEFADTASRQPDLILDAGPCSTGVESTVVSLVDPGGPVLLRHGGISVEEIESLIGPIQRFQVSTPQPSDLAMPGPGMLTRHYAPRTPLTLEDPDPRQTRTAKVGLLTLVQPENVEAYAVVEVLSSSGNLSEAAANLFAAMRRLDAAGLDLIVARPVPSHGLGLAINDRLRRASAK